MDNLTQKQIEKERELFEVTMSKMNILDFSRNSAEKYNNSVLEAFWMGWIVRAIVGFSDAATDQMCEAGEAMIYNGGHCDCGNPCEVDSEDVYKSMRAVAKNENKICGNTEILHNCAEEAKKLMQ